MNINKGITKKNNALDTPVKSLQAIIASKGMEAQFKAALPSVITPERFTRLVLTAISTTPKLAECTQQSFFGAIFQAAQLGLEPNTPTGQAYLIPYGKDCQFVLGYRGQVQLAYRSGEIKDIGAHVVCENDDFEYELGLEPRLMHKPKLGKRGNPIAVYAVYHTKTGGYGMEVMSWEEVMRFGKAKSKSFAKGPWSTDPEEMAKKTVVKRLLKYAPISADFARAMAADETVKNFDPSKDQASDLLDDMGTITIDSDTVKGESADMTPPVQTGEQYAPIDEEIPMPEDVDPATGEVNPA